MKDIHLNGCFAVTDITANSEKWHVLSSSSQGNTAHLEVEMGADGEHGHLRLPSLPDGLPADCTNLWNPELMQDVFRPEGRTLKFLIKGLRKQKFTKNDSALWTVLEAGECSDSSICLYPLQPGNLIQREHMAKWRVYRKWQTDMVICIYMLYITRTMDTDLAQRWVRSLAPRYVELALEIGIICEVSAVNRINDVLRMYT